MLPSTRFVQRQFERELPSEERFNELNICYRICYKFSQKSDDQETCVCDQPKHVHREQNVTSEHEKWNIKTHTEEKRQPVCQGQLVNGALFVRLDLKTKMNVVQSLLLNVWKIPRPKLIMSIIGGAKYFTLTDRVESNFINGIFNVAIRSNVWLITNGYNVGIVQLVGQAINKVRLRRPDQDMIAIGVCKWGSVKDVETVTGFKEQETNQRHMRRPRRNIDEEDTGERRSGERDLEMNHSHYLMLDDGRYRYFNADDFRTRLCSHLSNLEGKNKFHIPVVTIVVEGGRDTITNMYYDLKNNIPVVIIAGSGRIADFFNRWLLYTKEFSINSKQEKIIYEIDELTDITSVKKQHASKVTRKRTDMYVELGVDRKKKRLRDIFYKYIEHLENDLKTTLNRDDESRKIKRQDSKTSDDKDTKFQTAIDHVLYCLQPSIRSNITVFNLNSEDDLSETIFGSICKSYEKLLKKQKLEQNDMLNKDYENNFFDMEKPELLQLAMDWNCIDVAKDYVLQNSLDDITDKRGVFLDALKKNLHTFVYEFIKLRINPSEIFFPKDRFIRGSKRYDTFIRELYDNKIIENASPDFKSFIDDNGDLETKAINSTEALNIILRTLIGDYMHKLYFDTIQEEDDNRIKCGLIKYSVKKNLYRYNDIENKRSLSDEEKEQLPNDYIMRDLFLWSILMNYIDMAKVFLSYMKYRICPALIATKILKRFHHKATYSESKDCYKKSAEYFEQYAIDCLDKCNDYNADEACEIILQQNELYGYVTCLQVAADAEDKSFIARPCCTQAMYNVWYDKMYPEQTRKRDRLALFFGFITLGLLAPIIVRFRDKTEQNEPLKPALKSYGINYSDPYPLEHPRWISDMLPLNKYIHRLLNFHLSLMMKFCYHFIIYCFFLLLFSYFLLFNFSPPTDQIPSIHWTEILTIIFVSCMLVEEVHYFFSQDSLSFIGKSKEYLRDFFKWITIFAFVLFYIGLIVRFAYAQSEENFVVARVIMAFDIELWWLRFLSFIIVIPYLGPHLVAIGKMLQDLLFFICIIAIVMIGYGVASRSMVYYPTVNNFTTETDGPIDASFDGRSVFRQVIYPVYYLLHGEFGTQLDDLDNNPNAGWSISTHVLLAIHMLFVNILLTNLLIAMFSKRFEEVYEETEKIWHSQQYLFTREYYARSPFFPPISLLYDIYCLCRMFFFFVRRKCTERSADPKAKVFKIIPVNKSRIKEWHDFEGALTYQCAQAEVRASKVGLTKFSNGTDSSSKTQKKASNNNQSDSNNNFDNLQEVQDNVIQLNSLIEEMRVSFNQHFKIDQAR